MLNYGGGGVGGLHTTIDPIKLYSAVLEHN